MTKEQRQDWVGKVDEACDVLSDVFQKIDADYLYNEAAKLRHMASSVINYKFEREGKQ